MHDLPRNKKYFHCKGKFKWWEGTGPQGEGAEFDPAEGQTAPNPLPPLPWRLSGSPLLPQEGDTGGLWGGIISTSLLSTNDKCPAIWAPTHYIHRAEGPQSKLPHTRVSSLFPD